MTIRFVRSAEVELLEITDWYENRQEGTGLMFIEEVSVGLKSIEENPERFPAEETNLSARNIRRCRLNKFPHRIIYEITPRQLRVFAIAHYSRRPGYWLERLDEE